MNVTCQHCRTKLNIPDNKIPSDKDTTFKCPKCKEKILIPAVKPKKIHGPGLEDRLDALVCIDDHDMKQAHSVIEQLGFNLETAVDTKAALNKMEYHLYHLLIIDEAFDQNRGLSGIIDYMNAIDMSVRRRICIVLVSSRFNTNDNMAALHSSVNNIILREDSLHLEAFLSKALQDHKNFYTVYSESLKQAGKA